MKFDTADYMYATYKEDDQTGDLTFVEMKKEIIKVSQICDELLNTTTHFINYSKTVSRE